MNFSNETTDELYVQFFVHIQFYFMYTTWTASTQCCMVAKQRGAPAKQKDYA